MNRVRCSTIVLAALLLSAFAEAAERLGPRGAARDSTPARKTKESAPAGQLASQSLGNAGNALARIVASRESVEAPNEALLADFCAADGGDNL